jgi:uncharacterized protein (TIGR02145 family)
MSLGKDCGDGSVACIDSIDLVNHHGICPDGWHMPKNEEWSILVSFLGGWSVAGQKMNSLTFGGDNSSGFSALGAGGRNFSGDFGFHG